MVATCSVAISAACHMPTGLDHKGLLYEPLRWGQAGQVQQESAFGDRRGQAPVVGWHYAGVSSAAPSPFHSPRIVHQSMSIPSRSRTRSRGSIILQRKPLLSRRKLDVPQHLLRAGKTVGFFP